MQKHAIKIKFIPNKIINANQYRNLKFIGYKQITKYHIGLIIQLSNKKRVWILKYEIAF
uniref:Cytochrome b6-f complex subunit PetP n=1 Tax=Dipterosiphonia australica TaxID=2007208 RepID=A0A1Z1MLC7_9FLOR|nr:cytochrome b6-f complex subunit PetP [Dipterosiphonia australica]ARW66858.1 cytochrome b6-f complex subunit PetP [Dipterosiphonia australica]